MKLMDTLPFPPEVKTIPDAIALLEGLTRSVVRNMPDGWGVRLKIINERNVQYWVNDSTPAELSFGYVWAVANRFKPPYNIFVVRVVPNLNPTEEPGYAFDIKWGTLPQDVE